METLQINKENALVAYDQANEKGKALLSNLFGKEVFLRAKFKAFTDIKTLEDAVEYLGDEDQFVKEYLAAPVSLPKDVTAYLKLRLIGKALNGGRVMDWNNPKENKYYPYFNAKGAPGSFSSDFYGYSCSVSYVGSRLCYLSSEIAIYAGKQFIDIYNDYIN